VFLKFRVLEIGMRDTTEAGYETVAFCHTDGNEDSAMAKRRTAASIDLCPKEEPGVCGIKLPRMCLM